MATGNTVSRSVSLLKRVVLVLLVVISLQAKADYYVSYTSDSEPSIVSSGCCTQSQVIVNKIYRVAPSHYRHVRHYHHHHHHHPRHIVHYKKRSHYSITVYYGWQVSPGSCSCGYVWVPDQFTCYGEWIPAHWETRNCKASSCQSSCSGCASQSEPASDDTATADDAE